MPITHAAKHRKWGKLGNEKAEQVKARFLDQTSNRHLVRLLGTNQGDVGVFLHLLTIDKEEYDKQDSLILFS